jgi:hypothetical protein
MDKNEVPHDPRHLGVPSGTSEMISEPMVRSSQIVHQSCIKISTISKMDQKELLLEPRQLGGPLGSFKMIYEVMVCLALTVHLSCTDTNTISKQTETRFHMTHVIYHFHREHPKLFLSLWYAWRKPCTYLAPTLTLSKRTKTRFHMIHVT